MPVQESARYQQMVRICIFGYWSACEQWTCMLRTELFRWRMSEDLQDLQEFRTLNHLLLRSPWTDIGFICTGDSIWQSVFHWWRQQKSFLLWCKKGFRQMVDRCSTQTTKLRLVDIDEVICVSIKQCRNCDSSLQERNMKTRLWRWLWSLRSSSSSTAHSFN